VLGPGLEDCRQACFCIAVMPHLATLDREVACVVLVFAHPMRDPRGDDHAGLFKEIPVADQARPLMAHIPGWVRGFRS